MATVYGFYVEFSYLIDIKQLTAIMFLQILLKNENYDLYKSLIYNKLQKMSGKMYQIHYRLNTPCYETRRFQIRRKLTAGERKDSRYLLRHAA